MTYFFVNSNKSNINPWEDIKNQLWSFSVNSNGKQNQLPEKGHHEPHVVLFCKLQEKVYQILIVKECTKHHEPNVVLFCKLQ